jgi:Clostripain family
MTGYDKEWLVMIYLSADNDLSEESIWALTEIFRAGRSAKVAVVVQIDTRVGRIRRYDVDRLLADFPESKSVDRIDRELLSRGDELCTDNMASLSTLREFIGDCKKSYNARHSILILSGHSGGPTGNGFLIDLFPQHGLSLRKVRKAIKEAGSVDIVGMDSCGMGMAEVGVQLRDCTDFLVASEGFELNTGWPYFSILEALQKTPEVDPRTLAAGIVDTHTGYYANYEMAGVSTDMAACDLKKTPELVEAIKRLALELTRNLLFRRQFSHRNDSLRDKRIFVEDLPLEARAIADAIVLAHWRAQSYRFERHTDLFDLAKAMWLDRVIAAAHSSTQMEFLCFSRGRRLMKATASLDFPEKQVGNSFLGLISEPLEGVLVKMADRLSSRSHKATHLQSVISRNSAPKTFRNSAQKIFLNWVQRTFPSLAPKIFLNWAQRIFLNLAQRTFRNWARKTSPNSAQKIFLSWARKESYWFRL